MESKGPRGFESRGLKTSGGFKESSGATLPDVFVKLKGCKIGRRWMASCIYKFRFGIYIYKQIYVLASKISFIDTYWVHLKSLACVFLMYFLATSIYIYIYIDQEAVK